VTAPLAVDLGYFFFPPMVAAGIALGVVVPRWAILGLPLVLWLVPGLLYGVIPAVAGHGDPLAILVLWALYVPIPLAMSLTVGVALGRWFRRRGHPTES
jgi:hypothetical protein